MDHEWWVQLFGSLAMVGSLAIALVGLPQQAWANYRHRSCTGLSPVLVYSATITYGLWSVYGWVKPDIFLGISQTIGWLFSLVLLAQLWYYKEK